MGASYELTLYSFLDAQGQERDYTTDSIKEALAYARSHRLVMLENRYEFTDSEPVADFTLPCVCHIQED
jgi:hypothetical protein